MTDCPRCGKKIGLVIKIKCDKCGNKYCIDCGERFIAEIKAKRINDANGNPILSNYAVNRELCLNCLEDFEKRVSAEVLKANPYGFCPNCGLETAPTKFRLCLTDKVKFEFPNDPAFSSNMICMEAFCPKCSNVYSKKYYWADERPYDGKANFDDPIWLNYSQARMAESVERMDDAALGYERAGLLEKAKQLRIKNKNQVVHHITIDVNKLLEFLKQSNFTIPYRCPSCQATLKINSQRSADDFFKCEYCGTSLQAIDVQNLINGLM